MSQSASATNVSNHDVANLDLAAAGKNRITWADSQMPVLRAIRERFEKDKPLAGLRIAACLHVTSETANLMRTLKAGGAEPYLCASNPLSTSDEVAASLVADYGIPTFAIRGENNDVYYRHIEQVLTVGIGGAGIDACAEPDCPADFDTSGDVNIVDLLMLLAAWGTSDPLIDVEPPSGDGIVNILDLLFLVSRWGRC